MPSGVAQVKVEVLEGGETEVEVEEPGVGGHGGMIVARENRDLVNII